jgi:hypothetical protein
MRRISVVFVALMSLTLVACGGSSSKPEADTTTTAGGADTTSTAAAGPTTQAIDKTVWFAGFKVTLGTGTFTPEPSPKVEIATTFENLGADTARFDGSLVLDTAGNGITSTDLTDIPEVPGGSTGKGSIRFDVAPGFEFDGATVSIGSIEHQRALIPLGAEGIFVSLEPLPVTITGSATAGQLKLDAHDGEIRADIPETHGETDKDQLALTIKFDVTNSGTGGGGYPLVDDNFALTLPDGTTVAPDDAPIELLGHQATKKSLSARFLLDGPSAGEYTLLLREGQTEGQLKFTIEDPGGPSTTTTPG